MKRLLLLLLVGGISLTACEHLPLDRLLDRDDKPRDEEQAAQQRLRRMRAAIMEMVGQARCESVEDCRFIGLGAKPCGGPWEYLVYSVAQTDPEKLIAHVREYNQFERQINERFGRVSDCSLPAEPDLDCVEGRCVNLNRPIPPNPDPRQRVNLEVVDSFDLIDVIDDPFRINKGTLDGRALVLSVSYSGGCEEHQFSLLAEPELGEFDGAAFKELWLIHNSNGDGCEALITEDLVLNLGGLARLHPDVRSILVQINDFDELYEFIVPRPNDAVGTPTDRVEIRPADADEL